MADIKNEKRAEKKARKRAEATKRQEDYDKLTPKQKIDKLNASAWRAKKQREKLNKQLR